MELNEKQTESLQNHLYDLFKSEGIEGVTLEVTEVQDRGQYYRVYFQYELVNNTYGSSWVNFRCKLHPEKIEDFEESTV